MSMAKKTALALSGKGWAAHVIVGKAGKRPVFQIAIQDTTNDEVHVETIDPIRLVAAMRGSDADAAPEEEEEENGQAPPSESPAPKEPAPPSQSSREAFG